MDFTIYFALFGLVILASLATVIEIALPFNVFVMLLGKSLNFNISSNFHIDCHFDLRSFRGASYLGNFANFWLTKHSIVKI